MARPIWKGAISFGLVTIPVGLYPAIESREELSFHLLHAKDRSRIDYRRVCEAEGVEVPWKEIVKGYEYGKSQHVVLTDEDFAKAAPAGTKTFDIRAFVAATDVEDLYFDHPYYLAPSGRGAAKGYALLRDGLADEGKIGIGTFVFRQREHLGAIAPAGEALVLTTMRFAHEIRSPQGLDLPRSGTGWTAQEMKLAHQLIATLSADWHPADYRDTYTDTLRAIIEQKAAGEEIEVPAPARAPRVVDLMEALRKSLEETPRKGPSKAESRRGRPRRSRARHVA